MKYSILGFNQEKIVAYSKDGLKCDLIDLLLLNYIIYAQANPKMKHRVDDEMKPCVWLQHEHILKDLPILNITEGTLKNRLTKLRKMELITSKTIANENSQGSRTYYRTTSLLYDMLFETTSLKNDVIEEPRHSKMTSNTQVNNDKKVNKKNNSKELLQTPNFSFGKQKTKPKKESLYTKCASLIHAKTEDKEIQRLLFMWLNVLLEKYKDRGRTLYVNVFSGKLNMLDKYDRKDWKEIIEYNLQRGYEGFYPINNYTKSKDKRADENMVHVPSMTEEDYKREERELAELKKKGVRTTF